MEPNEIKKKRDNGPLKTRLENGTHTHTHAHKGEGEKRTETENKNLRGAFKLSAFVWPTRQWEALEPRCSGRQWVVLAVTSRIVRPMGGRRQRPFPAQPREPCRECTIACRQLRLLRGSVYRRNARKSQVWDQAAAAAAAEKMNPKALRGVDQHKNK